MAQGKSLKNKEELLPKALLREKILRIIGLTGNSKNDRGKIAEFVRKCGLNQNTVSRWIDEENPQAPSAENLYILRKRLNIDLNEFLFLPGRVIREEEKSECNKCREKDAKIIDLYEKIERLRDTMTGAPGDKNLTEAKACPSREVHRREEVTTV